MHSGWLVFKRLRVAFFALSTILCMTLTVIYSVLLFREWAFYDVAQRCITIMLISVNGISSILLYLMIIVRFRFWLDVARVGSLLGFQIGGNVVFIIFQSELPCQNLGSPKDCEQVLSSVSLISWALSGILLLYTFTLLYSRSLNPPTGPPDPEARLMHEGLTGNRNSYASVDSKTSLMKLREPEEKSKGIHLIAKYPAPPFLIPEGPSFTINSSMSNRAAVIDNRSLSPVSISNGHSFNDRTHSPAFAYIYKTAEPFQQHLVLNKRQMSSNAHMQPPLPNPFITHDPISRQGTSFSTHTYLSSLSDTPYSPTQLPLLSVPVHSYQERIHSPDSVSHHSESGISVDHSADSQVDTTPLALRPSVNRFMNQGPKQYFQFSREGLAQPGIIPTRKSYTYNDLQPSSSYSTHIGNSGLYSPFPLAVHPHAYRIQELRRYGLKPPMMSWNRLNDS
ncbi:hypothetical protein BDQ17DRAFT_1426161 [Cyathus striatus]|nr:hypothetical protein BDQ17DRAFT_1426161 [Cyathus striatus]